MRVLVTGGAGFVGSTIVDRLLQNEHTVHVVDNMSRGKESNLHWAIQNGAELSTIDVLDNNSLLHIASLVKPEVIFHLAAQIDVRVSMQSPAEDARTNIIGTINVLGAAASTSTDRVVFSSTGGAIYGNTHIVPTPETEPTQPTSAYGLSKLSAERYTEWFRQAYGLNTVVLRYGNVYGPRQDPHGDAGVIALFCDAALSGEPPLVFGDGEQTRDFVFVEDIATANIAAATHEIRSGKQTYNIGSGIETSVLGLIDSIRNITGHTINTWKPNHLPERSGEIRRSCLDIRSAQADLALEEPTMIEAGMRKTLDWIRQSASARQFHAQ